MLRYAYNTNGCAHHRLPEALDLIAEAGYAGVALTLDWQHLDVMADDYAAQAERLGQMLRERALGLVVETGARFMLDPRRKHEPTLMSAEAEGRARRLDMLTRALDVCAICGGETVSFWSGPVAAGVSETDAWARLEDGVADLVRRAAVRGVEASFEPEPGHLTERLADYDRLARAAPGLRLALDTGHLLVTGEADPAEALRRYASHVGTVAVEDMDRGVHLHKPFGTGDVDVPSILASLHDIRFERLVTVELSRESPRAHDAIPESIAFLRAAEEGLGGWGLESPSDAGAMPARIPVSSPRHPTPTTLRICFLSRRVFPTISGMSVYALNLVRQLAERGHDVTLLGEHYGGAAAAVYGSGPPRPIPGVRVVGMESVGEGARGDFEADIEVLVRRVEAEHAAAPFDVLHAQYGYPTGYAALEAGRRTGVPVVVSIQGGDGHWVGACCQTHRRAMQTVLDHAGAVLIGSESFARAVHARLGTPLERFTIVPGAVDTDRFVPDGRALGRLGAPPALLYHGRVDRRKGVLDLLDALALLRATRDVRLVVSGIGPDVEAVARRAEALGLSDAVTVLGIASYDAAPARYHAGDVFVSPTYAEGFSNTILEAMASGLPVVSCSVVGVVDCLAHGHNALLVPPADPPALAAALARMLDDAPLRERLARTAFDEARALYSWDARAEQIAGLYASLLGTAPSTAWTYETDGSEPCRYRETPHLL